MNIKNAFIYMFKDKQLWSKYLVGVVLVLISILSNLVAPRNPMIQIIPFIKDIAPENLGYIFYSLSIIGFLAAFVGNGYNVLNLNTRIYKPDADLPCWSNIKNILSAALKLFAICVIYVALLSIVLVFLMIVFTIVISLFLKADLQVLMSVSTLICFVIAALVAFLFFPAIYIAFATNLKIASVFNAKLIFNIIKENKMKYFICIVSLFIFVVLNAVLIQVVYTRFYPVIILLPFIFFYTTLVLTEIQASVPRPDDNNRQEELTVQPE